MKKLQLSFDLKFDDLYQHQGLLRIHAYFLRYLQDIDSNLSLSLTKAYESPLTLNKKEESLLLIQLAPHVENFLSYLFNIKTEVSKKKESYKPLDMISFIKRQFVQRVALRKYSLNIPQVNNSKFAAYNEHDFAHLIAVWLKNEHDFEKELDEAAQFVAWACLTQEGKKEYAHWVLFQTPKKIDPLHLIPHLQKTEKGYSFSNLFKREGFNLTDHGVSDLYAQDQAHYCIGCHQQGKDSCSKGLLPKKDEGEPFQKSPLGATLAGCPLEEKISEMNTLKTKGHFLGALCVAMIDNPLLAATGNRICNDCMKACIYQKQEPVNIPSVETQILKDCLDLPFGFEIYSLLTRWNPLNFERPLPKEQTHKQILVVGMGPSGFNLAHHLLNEGHSVLAIDGLKIEPLSSWQNGRTVEGCITEFTPIYDWNCLKEPLSTRITGGFGGVAEYGITVRWDKNFLKIIRILLERRSTFQLIGGVRFGGALGIQEAFDFGFDHVALCMGAGSPTLIPMKNGLAPGVRQASDFLMALQLTGALKENSLSNLLIRLPAVVIGGGLTAIDTATEAMAYYPLQVKKFKKRYDTLVKHMGVEEVRKNWTPQDHQIADEMLFDAEEFLKVSSPLEVQKLIQEKGGVTLVYRKELTQAPSYTLNHEEIEKALEQGIYILPEAQPLEVEIDEFGHAKGLKVKTPEGEKTLKARSIFIAAGTKPNTNLCYDEKTSLQLEKRYGNPTFEAINEEGEAILPEKSAKPKETHIFTHQLLDGRRVSFFGDLHPSFAGNVVKAMASAKRGYPLISKALKPLMPSSKENLLAKMNKLLRAKVHKIERLTPTIIEVTIHAPLAAKAFQPGQFYRLQNFESLAEIKHDTRLLMEGLALTGACVDREKGLISMIVLEMGGSSSLCAQLKEGEPVILMGPTGTPTHIPSQETVLLIGGGLGNAVLFSIGQAMREKGCKVLYVAGYKQCQDRYKINEIESAADEVIWCCDEAPGFKPTRPQDKTYVGNIIEALKAFAKGELGESRISLKDVNRMIVIGSDRMMAAVAKARHTVLKDFMNPNHFAIGSINSPMQCMMKEICAQCLQIHKDPLTGKEKIVYSCANQDQELDYVDFNFLNQRLSQNSVQEKLTAKWIGFVTENLSIS